MQEPYRKDHTPFKAIATDHKFSSVTDSQTINIDYTLILTIDSPVGTVGGLFDISGMVELKESISKNDGLFTCYTNSERSCCRSISASRVEIYRPF